MGVGNAGAYTVRSPPRPSCFTASGGLRVSPPYTERTRAEKICAQETMEKQQVSWQEQVLRSQGDLHVGPERWDAGLWEPGSDSSLCPARLEGMSSCPGTGFQELRGPCLAISLHYSRSIHASLSVNVQLGIKIYPSPSPPLTEWVTLLTPLHLIERQLAPW